MLIIVSMMMAFFGALIALDRTAACQVMISRPLVVSSFIGLVFGNITYGLTLGFLIELLWIERLPVGSSLIPNETALSVVASSVVFLAGSAIGVLNREIMVFVIMLFLPVGWIFQKVDWFLRDYNSKLSSYTLRAVEKVGDKAVDSAILKGLGLSFILHFIILFVLIVFGTFLVRYLYPLLNSDILSLLGMLFYIFPVVGTAAAINSIKSVRRPIVQFTVFYILFVLITFGYNKL